MGLDLDFNNTGSNKGGGAKPKQMNCWECIFHLGSRFILSGHGVALLVLGASATIVILVLGGMESEDKRLTIEAFLNWSVLKYLGWLIAIIVVPVCAAALKFQRRAYEKQLEFQRQALNKALVLQEKLPLVSREE